MAIELNNVLVLLMNRGYCRLGLGIESFVLTQVMTSFKFYHTGIEGEGDPEISVECARLRVIKC